jgi:very-short-patch-repair endonuclease
MSTDPEPRLRRGLGLGPEASIYFRQKYAISPFIADFCAARIKLIIEVDGGQPLEQAADDYQRKNFSRAKDTGCCASG